MTSSGNTPSRDASDATHAEPAEPSPLVEPNAEGLNIEVGPYRLVSRLGEGGMGTVYRADQHRPVRRTVALKLIKPGFDSSEIIARFESERQALALMDHPHIARVLDAGTDALGRPYFVMEYVPGVPITRYADENKLPVRRRLELFMQVCSAIAHAHTKAILHRDIKAGNVLAYTASDGSPTAKVIDFGIAKAMTGDKLTDRTFATGSGQIVGTYTTMSPEQADGSPDIDTRTDVYSLGVLLYELLAGVQPLDKEMLGKAADEELRRIIREVDPPRPSTRLSGLSPAVASQVAAARNTQVHSLARQLRGELEWIPLKAMRKERGRRYDSARQLAEDVERYLSGQPLLAAPESRVYRVRKFARRHSGAIAVAGLLVLLTAGGVTAYIQGMRSQQGRTDAALVDARQQKNAADAQRLHAEQSARIALARLAEVDTREGWARMDAGDPCTALLWFTRALETVAADPPEAIKCRLRIASLLATLPRLVDDSRLPAINPDFIVTAGNRVVTGPAMWKYQMVDETTRKPLGALIEHDRTWVCTLSPDGRRFVTASLDETAQIWDTQTGKPLTSALKHGSAVVKALFSPDSRWVATASLDHWAQVWDVETGQPLGPRIKHAGSISSIRFSADGKRVATASADRTARIWDAATAAPLTAPLSHGEAATCVAFSADDKLLATGSEDRTARVWDASTGALRAGPFKQDAPVSGVSFSRDGKRLAVAEAGTAYRVWDLATGLPLTPSLTHPGMRGSPVFSADGNMLQTTAESGTIRSWDLVDRRPVPLPLVKAGRPLSVRFTMAMKSEARAKPALREAEIRPNGWWLVFSPDGQRLAAAPGDARVAGIYDLRTGKRITPPMRHDGIIWMAAFSGNGKRLATACDDGTVHVWDAATGQPVGAPIKLRGSPFSTSVAMSPDGERVAAAGAALGQTGSGEAGLWNVRTGRPVFPPLSASSGGFETICLSPDATRFATSTNDGCDLWSASTGQRVGVTMRHAGTISAVAFDPSGRLLATASADKTARVWDLATCQPVTVSMVHEDAVRSVAFNHDGTRLVTASDDGTARVWDTTTGEPLTLPLRHDARVARAIFDTDGRQVVTATETDQASIWNVVPDPRPCEDLRDLAEVITGMRMDATRTLAALTGEEWIARWNRLRARYPEQFRPRNAVAATRPSTRTSN